WVAKFHENAKCLCLSQGEREAFDFIGKAKFADDQLPDFLKSTRDPNSQGMIGFPDSGSEILALPSTEKAGHGTDASVAVFDEADFHPYLEINFAAVKPTIDAGGLGIMLSKRDKTRKSSTFTKFYLQGKTKDSNFISIFLPALLPPGRTLEWIEYVSKDLPQWQRDQEYPLTEAAFLSTPDVIKFYDIDALSNMEARSIKPIKHELSDKYKTVRIYKPCVVGVKYCCFTDPSDGKEDPHVIIVVDAQTGEEVACSWGKTPATQCAQMHDELIRYYNNAYNTGEVNAKPGGIFIKTLEDLGTPNMHVQNKNKVGWWTSSGAKRDMIWGLEDAVRNIQIQIHTPEARDELSDIQQIQGEDPQAPQGGHDDFMMAWGGLCQIRRDVKFGGIKIESFSYRA
ncbi:hypothetical protein LCGC14_2367610, partial [marine sediment metagenome]